CLRHRRRPVRSGLQPPRAANDRLSLAQRYLRPARRRRSPRLLTRLPASSLPDRPAYLWRAVPSRGERNGARRLGAEAGRTDAPDRATVHAHRTAHDASQFPPAVRSMDLARTSCFDVNRRPPLMTAWKLLPLLLLAVSSHARADEPPKAAPAGTLIV